MRTHLPPKVLSRGMHSGGFDIWSTSDVIKEISNWQKKDLCWEIFSRSKVSRMEPVFSFHVIEKNNWSLRYHHDSNWEDGELFLHVFKKNYDLFISPVENEIILIDGVIFPSIDISLQLKAEEAYTKASSLKGYSFIDKLFSKKERNPSVLKGYSCVQWILTGDLNDPSILVYVVHFT